MRASHNCDRARGCRESPLDTLLDRFPSSVVSALYVYYTILSPIVNHFLRAYHNTPLAAQNRSGGSSLSDVHEDEVPRKGDEILLNEDESSSNEDLKIRGNED